MSSRPKANAKVERTASGAVDADGLAMTSDSAANVSTRGSKRRRNKSGPKTNGRPSDAAFARPTNAADTVPIRTGKSKPKKSSARPAHRNGVSTFDFLPSLTTFFVLAHFMAVGAVLYFFVL